MSLWDFEEGAGWVKPWVYLCTFDSSQRLWKDWGASQQVPKKITSSNSPLVHSILHLSTHYNYLLTRLWYLLKKNPHVSEKCQLISARGLHVDMSRHFCCLFNIYLWVYSRCPIQLEMCCVVNWWHAESFFVESHEWAEIPQSLQR